MKRNLMNSEMSLLEMNDTNNSSTHSIHNFNIPSGDGIPILKFNEVKDAISMYKILSLIAFLAVLAVVTIGYIHLA